VPHAIQLLSVVDGQIVAVREYVHVDYLLADAVVDAS
jgi:hypothetical protein